MDIENIQWTLPYDLQSVQEYLEELQGYERIFDRAQKLRQQYENLRIQLQFPKAPFVEMDLNDFEQKLELHQHWSAMFQDEMQSLPKLYREFAPSIPKTITAEDVLILIPQISRWKRVYHYLKWGILSVFLLLCAYLIW